VLLGVLLLALSACKPASPPQIIGLSTSLPLVWSEAGDIRGELAAKPATHWAMGALTRHGTVRPLDSLAGPGGALPLPHEGLLVLAQPQPLTPLENVALDTWVRKGGHVLLLADPMLTMPSAFALGDPRGPQRVALLSPILRHWGLELQFDPSQPAGERIVDVPGGGLPVNLAGRFARIGDAPCRLEAQNIIATCRVGRGQIVAVADAAVFDGDDAGRAAAWDHLLVQAKH